MSISGSSAIEKPKSRGGNELRSWRPAMVRAKVAAELGPGSCGDEGTVVEISSPSHVGGVSSHMRLERLHRTPRSLSCSERSASTSENDSRVNHGCRRASADDTRALSVFSKDFVIRSRHSSDAGMPHESSGNSTCIVRTSCPWNGLNPNIISYKRHPYGNMSAFSVACSPRMHSGAMYPMVPAGPLAGLQHSQSFAESFVSRARPRSIMKTLPFSVTSTFRVFTSLCTTPRRCM
mmetsp:Transcript_49243/g.120064  ORF Transcript_49243/g.120064 Transcript_49243/m.120064 type:complete len:235 (-) Transcript_49243:1283-1987(-)